MIQLEIQHDSLQNGTGETPTRCWCSGIMQDSHSCDPGSIPGQRTVLTYRPALPSSKDFPNFGWRTKGSLAEWSKALVLGTSPKGRGFESLSCQNDNFASIKRQGKKWFCSRWGSNSQPRHVSSTVYKYRALTDCATGAMWPQVENQIEWQTSLSILPVRLSHRQTVRHPRD